MTRRLGRDAALDIQYGLASTLLMIEMLRAPSPAEALALNISVEGFLQDATRLLEENRWDVLAAFQAAHRMVRRELEQRLQEAQT